MIMFQDNSLSLESALHTGDFFTSFFREHIFVNIEYTRAPTGFFI